MSETCVCENFRSGECIYCKYDAQSEENFHLRNALQDIAIGQFPGTTPYTKIRSALKRSQERAKEALASKEKS